jgi:signal transduction histidine kinase
MKKKINPIFYVFAWLLLTLSLAGWWMIYGLRQIERMSQLEKSLPTKLLTQQRMLHWEGSTLFLLLVIGGSALLTYAFRERKRSLQVSEFFATLTHEFKTPLASLRLQAESLQEDLGENSGSSKIVERLVRDTVRLELQLENALFLASVKSQKVFHLENISLCEILEGLKSQWPELKIGVPRELKVKADSRALEGVLKNIFLNSRVHGKAQTISVVAPHGSISESKLGVKIFDDGVGFRGDHSKLGKLFSRPTPQSGSGVGLYLVKSLISNMRGQVEFLNMSEKLSTGDKLQGFSVILWFEKAVSL